MIRSTADLARRIGVTVRQLDHWQIKGYLPRVAPGTGNPRGWTLAECRLGAVMAALVHAGLTVEAAAKHALYAQVPPWTEIGVPGVDLRIHTGRIWEQAGL